MKPDKKSKDSRSWLWPFRRKEGQSASPSGRVIRVLDSPEAATLDGVMSTGENGGPEAMGAKMGTIAPRQGPATLGPESLGAAGDGGPKAEAGALATGLPQDTGLPEGGDQPPEAEAGKDGLGDDLMDLFTEETKVNENLNRLVEGLAEINIHELAGESQRVAAQLRQAR